CVFHGQAARLAGYAFAAPAPAVEPVCAGRRKASGVDDVNECVERLKNMGVELICGRRVRAIVAAFGVAALTLTGCTVGDGDGSGEAAKVEEAKPKPVANVKDGAEGWSVTEPVTVSIDDAKLDSVTMTNEAGK